MTITLPLLLMILHFSQIGLTEALTFMLSTPFKHFTIALGHLLSILWGYLELFISVGYTAPFQIIRAQFHCHLIPWKDTDIISAYLS